MDEIKFPERRPKAELTGKQRRALKGEAHHLNPLVRIGQQGLDEGVRLATIDALLAHELIKVKLLKTAPCSVSEAGEWLAEGCGAHFVGKIGRIAMLYRRHPDRPQVALPRP